MRVLLVTSLLTALCVASNTAAAKGFETVRGVWVTPGYGSKVDLQSCQEPAQKPTLCGTIVWLWDAVDKDGRPVKDANNKKATKRNRDLLGTRILWGFKQDQDGVWRGGRLYNPEDGNIYTGSLWLEATDEVTVKGCTMRFLCRSQTWRRNSAFSN